jgi:hypothetical protein
VGEEAGQNSLLTKGQAQSSRDSLGGQPRFAGNRSGDSLGSQRLANFGTKSDTSRPWMPRQMSPTNAATRPKPLPPAAILPANFSLLRLVSTLEAQSGHPNRCTKAGVADA